MDMETLCNLLAVEVLDPIKNFVAGLVCCSTAISNLQTKLHKIITPTLLIPRVGCYSKRFRTIFLQIIYLLVYFLKNDPAINTLASSAKSMHFPYFEILGRS